MTIILTLFMLILGLNLIPMMITKPNEVRETKIARAMFFMSVVIGIIICGKLSGIYLKGLHSYLAVCIGFLATVVLYFSVVSNTRFKIVSIPLLTGLSVLCLATLIFDRKTYQKQVSDNNSVIVTSGGFLACGQSIRLTKSYLFIFDKELNTQSNLCLRGIERIDIVNFDSNKAVISIYHNGQLDSENPYTCEIENDNLW